MSKNVTDRGEQQFLEKNVRHCHLDHHKFHVDWPGIKRLDLRMLTTAWFDQVTLCVVSSIS